jgi:hypothetical protein
MTLHPRRPIAFGAQQTHAGPGTPEHQPLPGSDLVLHIAQAQARFLARFIQEVIETLRQRDRG